MSYWVYILKSDSSGRYYCGHTSNVTRRLSQHNDPGYTGSRTTKVFKGPWILIATFECENKGDAVILEKKIKKRGIGRFLDDRSAESRLRRD